MKSINTLLLCTFALLLLTACGDEPKEKPAKAVAAGNPVDTYLNSRVNAMEMAQKSVAQSNKHTEEQNKAMEALVK